MTKLHVWGFHTFVTQGQFNHLSIRIGLYFGNQPGLVKIASHFDYVSGLATFEVVAKEVIDHDSIKIMETILISSLEVANFPFSNEDGSGNAHEALFLVTNIGSLPGIVAQAIRSDAMSYFINGYFKVSLVTQDKNTVIVSIVANEGLPDLFVEQVYRLVAGWPVYYRNHITFERQTK